MPTQDASERETISIQELVGKIRAARENMGASNPNKLLLSQCEAAILYLSTFAPDEPRVGAKGVL